MRQLCACDLLLFVFYIYRLQDINFQLKVLHRLQLFPLVLSGHYISLLSNHAQQKRWCKFLGNQDFRNQKPKTQYQPVQEGKKSYLMDCQYHLTTEEQTGSTQKFVPFVTSNTLQDQSKVAALSNKHQTYTKLYRLLLTCCCFLSN